MPQRSGSVPLAKGYGVPFPVLMNWAGYMESGLSANQERALSYLGSDVSDDELELIRAFLDAICKQRATFNILSRILSSRSSIRAGRGQPRPAQSSCACISANLPCSWSITAGSRSVVTSPSSWPSSVRCSA